MDPIVLQFQGFVTDLNTVEKRKIVALTEIARDALQKNPHVAPYLAQTVINRILQVCCVHHASPGHHVRPSHSFFKILTCRPQ